MRWDRKFDEPIPLPKDKKLVTLRDAALYITKLPKAEHDAVEWLAAMEALILVELVGQLHQSSSSSSSSLGAAVGPRCRDWGV
jgi:hypothetical protein